MTHIRYQIDETNLQEIGENCIHTNQLNSIAPLPQNFIHSFIFLGKKKIYI